MTETEQASMGPVTIDRSEYPTLGQYALPLLPPAGRIIGREDEVQQVLATMLRPRLSNLLLVGPAGSGKALTLDTEIPTPTGWTTMGELAVGDEVLGQDGKPTRVSFLSEINETPELYALTFSDGSVVRACADHQWKVSSVADREAQSPSRRARAQRARLKAEAVPGLHRGDNAVPRRVRTTRELIAGGVRVGDDRLNFAIDVAAPLDLPDADLPMDPYVLGVWLGDGIGCFKDQAGICSVDQPVIARVVKRFGAPVHRVELSSGKTPVHHFNGLGSALRSAGLISSEPKRIPEAFLRASYEQRLELLRGLLDTDGHIDATGGIELALSCESLAIGAEELIRTLGIKVTRRVSEAGYRDENGAFVRCRDRHRMCFTTDLPVFTLPRHVARLPKSVRPTQKLLYIESIEPVASEPSRCIQVDNDDHMYLAGRGFAPTHNTVLVQETMGRDPDRTYLEVDLARLQGGVGMHQMAAEVKRLFDEAEAYARGGGRELVLFIDEIHQIVQMDAAAVEALKPVLAASGARGLKIIGATTYEEWIKYIRPNKPLDERLQRINLTPADRAMTIDILRSFAEEEGVGSYFGTHTDGLLGQIHDMTNLYVPSSVQPRKSIGILDGMIGWHRQTGERLDIKLLAKVMRQSLGIEIAFEIDGSGIKDELDKRVFAQDLATRTMADQLQLVVAGLNDTGRPKGRFLLAGSTGTGKTELTKQLASLVFGDDTNRFIRFDMSEFARKESMELFRSELTKKVVSMGEAVVLLDEIEKADRAVLRLLLQVLDDGRMSDDEGRQVSFLNCYIVMTTNAGSEVFNTIGAYSPDDVGGGKGLDGFLKAIENSIRKDDFPPELLGRLDKIVPFQPLSDMTKRRILERGLDKLRRNVLDKHGVVLGINKRVIEYLAIDVGQDDAAAGGARESMRALQNQVTVEVAKFINTHPEAKKLLLSIDGTMRAEDPNLLKSTAWPVVKAAPR